MMQIRPMAPFGVEILDVRADTMTDEDLRAFVELFRDYSLVKLHDPMMTPEGQLRLLGSIGPVVREMMGGGNVNYVAHDPVVPGPPVGRGELQFHFDMVWADDWPFHAISLYAEVVPSQGGETRFVHGGLAYRQLPDALRSELQDRRAVHIFDPYLPPDVTKLSEDMMSVYAERAIHDVVSRHPYRDEPVLTVGYINADRVVGMSGDASRALLRQLYASMYAPDALYVQNWKVGDFVVWDNRVVQHARGDFDPAERRRLRRVSVGDQTSIQRRTRRYMEQVPAEAGIEAQSLLNSLPDAGVERAMTEAGARG